MAPCPVCGAPTAKVYGYHRRTVWDVPVGGRPIVVALRVRRLVCPALICRLQTFREQIPGLPESHQRRTVRLAWQISRVARELCGHPPLRPAGRARFPRTALRHLRRQPLGVIDKQHTGRPEATTDRTPHRPPHATPAPGRAEDATPVRRRASPPGPCPRTRGTSRGPRPYCPTASTTAATCRDDTSRAPGTYNRIPPPRAPTSRGTTLRDRPVGGGCLYVFRQGIAVGFGVVRGCWGYAASSMFFGVRDS
ncbi:transposase family protein [Streptomyces sp. ST2-7A]|nr:transposase family protein [Streptomyces sp. ST2-7A]